MGVLYRSPVGDHPEAVGTTDFDQWWPTVDSVSILAVPYHLDERLDGFETALPADRQVTAALPATGPWQRMAVLYEQVADAVAEQPDRPVEVLGVFLGPGVGDGQCPVAGQEQTGVIWPH